MLLSQRLFAFLSPAAGMRRSAERMTGDGFGQDVTTCTPQKKCGLEVEVWAQVCLSRSLQKNKWEWRSERLVLGGSDIPASENSVELLGKCLEPPV